MKKSAALFVTLLALPSLCLAAIKGVTPDYLQKAEEAIQAEDYDTALAALDEAIKQHPENTAARVWRARILAEKGQLDKAQADLDDVLRTEPGNAGAIAQRGYLAQKRGQFDAALADFNTALRLNPGDDWALYCRGLIFAGRGQPLAALADLDAALEANPRNVGALLGRGQVRLYRREWDQAETDFDAAVRLAPKEPSAHAGLGAASYAQGTILAEQKKTDEARDAYKQAIDEFGEVVKLLPKDSRPLVERGDVFTAMKDFAKARADYDAAIALNAKDANAFVSRGDLARAQKKWADALPDYEAALALDEANYRACMGRAAAHYGGGSMDKALADYAESVKRFPEEPQPYNDYAWLLATGTTDALRDGKRAVELADQACKLTDYKNGAYLDTLAAAFAEKGDFGEALKWQELAVQDASDEPEEVQADIRKRVELYREKKPYREAPGEGG